MIRLHVGRFELILIISTLLASVVIAEDWTRWRGPRQDGISQERGLLKQWPAEGPKTFMDCKAWWWIFIDGGF